MKHIEFDVVLKCANLGSAEIVRAEIKHKLGYDAEMIIGVRGNLGNGKIIINVRETATISEIDALIHWLETPVPGSKADNVIEGVLFTPGKI